MNDIVGAFSGTLANVRNVLGNAALQVRPTFAQLPASPTFAKLRMKGSRL